MAGGRPQYAPDRRQDSRPRGPDHRGVRRDEPARSSSGPAGQSGSRREREHSVRRDRDRERRPSASRDGPSPSEALPPPPVPQKAEPAKVPAPRPATGNIFASSLVADAARVLREKREREEAAKRAADADGNSPIGEGDLEEGEVAEAGEVQPVRKRAKHSPIVWKNPRAAGSQSSHSRTASPEDVAGSGTRADSVQGRAAANSTVASPDAPSLRHVPRSAAELAALELEQFHASQQNGDANAGPVMKDSPILSDAEDDPLQARMRQQAAAAAANASDHEDAHPAASAGPISRWADLDDEDEQPRKKQKKVSVVPEGEMAQVDLSPQDQQPDAPALSPGPDPDAPIQQDAVYIDMLNSCRSVTEFKKVKSINEGTYGMVYRAEELKTGKHYALKKIKMDRERDGFPQTSIREINILLSLRHPNIVNVTEVVVGSKMNDIFMVMEFVEHDLRGLLDNFKNAKKAGFNMPQIKTLMQQLLEGVRYLHDNWVIHRDLKTSNILYSNRGELKICDFGLARQYGSPLGTYTSTVVTLYYRAPELLLGCKHYSTAIDMWSMGIIMAELLKGKVPCMGKSELDQASQIWNLVGTPNEKNWPTVKKDTKIGQWTLQQKTGNLEKEFPRRTPLDFDTKKLSDAGFELLQGLLTLDPAQRLTAEEALRSPWFSEAPFPTHQHLMPTFALSDGGEGVHHHKDARHASTGAPRMSQADLLAAKSQKGSGTSAYAAAGTKQRA